MSGPYARGKKALGICDRCGFTFKLKELREEIVKGRRTNLRVCSECLDPDHPQLRLGDVIVRDPQALKNARPDSGEYAASRAVIVPLRGVRARAEVTVPEVSTP